MKEANGAVPPLVIRLFGPFEVQVNGTALPRLRTRKGQWLLALLALRPGAEIQRAWLAGTLWPDSSEGQALTSLRVSLVDLRRALGSEAARLRSPTPHHLSLDLWGAAADVVAFDAATDRGDRVSLEEAVALYRGPLLEGCAEEWAFQERQVRAAAYLSALETLAADSRAGGEPEAAERYLRRVVAVDPLRETAQRALMQALAASGNYAAAMLAYRELRLRLHREINVQPDPETQALFQRLRAEARRAPGRPSAPPRRASSPAPTTPRRPLIAGGTVTFLFTDVEGSSQLWEQHPEAMREALARHDSLLRRSIEGNAGDVFKTVGDGFYAAFATAAEAVAAALEAQQALQAEAWGEVPPLRVRMALHTGTAEEREGDYFGPPLNRVARLLDAGHGGQILLSLATQELACETLPSEVSLKSLGSQRLRDLQRPEQVFQLAHPALPAAFPPLRSLEAAPNNLPVQLTSFIGREQEAAEVKRLLGHTHLLTLTGSGGCGKTRLALQVAADLLEAYANGVWLVELAPLADPALVPQAVASALGVREVPGQPLLQTLASSLRPKALLLLLDNCEHLLAACATLAEALLRGCPGVRILATSREGLNIPGERTYRLPSLSLPDLRHLPPTLEGLSQYEAVRLFIDRSLAVLPAFMVTNESAPAVAQICARLDGIPLALELAAARVKALPVEQINERLDDRFRLLTGGSRTALPRQQTLRALIDWSYDLLSEAERALLRRLSVFAGGWTLAAAEAVGAGEGIEAWEVLDLLTSLVEKSLVLYEERSGEERYRLLETVRQYARERLPEVGEGAAVRERHRDWFLALAEQAEPELVGAEQVVWLERLEREHDNLRAALAWSKAQGQGEQGLRLGGALGQVWDWRGYLGEGQEHLAGLLALPGAEARTAARAKALAAAGTLAWWQGDYAEAWALLEESLAIFWEIGDKGGIAWSLNHLGGAARNQGDYGTARAHLEESLAIFRELGHKQGIAWSLRGLGNVARDQREYGAARAHLEESLAIFRELGFKQGIAPNLEELAAVAVAQAQPERAAHLFGAAEGLREAMGAPLPPAERAEHDRCVAAAFAALGEEAFAAAWAAGRAMPLEQACAYALHEEANA